ncbi:MAG: DUF4162 domain-containing protein [Bacillota bacterium]
MVLATHSMEEAERLCDRVAIMDHGRVVALGSPASLVASLDTGHRLVFVVDGPSDANVLTRLAGVIRVERIGDRVVVCQEREGLLSDVVSALETNGTRFHNMRTEEPTLEDVFLAWTGREMRS